MSAFWGTWGTAIAVTAALAVIAGYIWWVIKPKGSSDHQIAQDFVEKLNGWKVNSWTGKGAVSNEATGARVDYGVSLTDKGRLRVVMSFSADNLHIAVAHKLNRMGIHIYPTDKGDEYYFIL